MSIWKPLITTSNVYWFIVTCFMAWIFHDCLSSMKRSNDDLTPTVIDLCMKTCKPSGVSSVTTTNCDCKYSR